MRKVTYTIEYGQDIMGNPEFENHSNFAIAAKRAESLAKSYDNVYVSCLRKNDGQRVYYNRNSGAAITGRPW